MDTYRRRQALQRVGHLFGAETEDEVREQGTLRFHFLLLVPILKDPRRFARLRTHFLIELSGKYSVTLYELLESVAKTKSRNSEPV